VSELKVGDIVYIRNPAQLDEKYLDEGSYEYIGVIRSLRVNDVMVIVVKHRDYLKEGSQFEMLVPKEVCTQIEDACVDNMNLGLKILLEMLEDKK